MVHREVFEDSHFLTGFRGWKMRASLGMSLNQSLCLSFSPFPIGHVRYIDIQAWLRGFGVKIANFSSLFCPPIPKRDLHVDAKKTTPNIEV